MPIKLYGSPSSTCTGRVLVALREKGVTDFELIPVDLQKGEHKAPEFLARQPFGQIPYIHDTDNDLYLFESRAICRYIASKYKGGADLNGASDPKKAALIEQWASVEAFNYDPHCSKIVAELVFKKFRGQTADLDAVVALKASLEKTLDIYEAHLAKNQYLAGDSFSLADLFHLTYTNLLFVAGHGDALTSRPHVKAWWERISSRQAWLDNQAKVLIANLILYVALFNIYCGIHLT